jgi:hypothetical protein
MAKKARIGVTARQRHSPETILALIKSLPAAEKERAFDLVSGDPENKSAWELLQLLLDALRKFDKLWGSIKKLRDRIGDEDSLREQLDDENAGKLFEKLRQTVERLQPKRGMTRANQETLNHFQKLLEKHGRQRGGRTKALKELVTLPSEQGKKYVRDYQASRDNNPEAIGYMEPVRQHVNRLERTGRKRQ